MDLDKAEVWDALQNHDPALMLRVIHSVAWLGHNCARRTTTVSPWGFPEQMVAKPDQSYPSLPKPLNDKKRKGGCYALTARMHRSPSEVRGARA